MNILWYLVKDLNQDELRHYRIYARRFTRKENRKDWKLLELYRSAEEPDDEKLRPRLYGAEVDGNTFARLKNRLAADINKALIMKALNEKAFEPWFLFLVFKYHDLRNRHDVAVYYLRKALKKAEDDGYYELALMLCHHFFRSVRYRAMEKEDIILQKRDQLERLSQLQRRLEAQSALLEEELRRSQSLYEPQASLLREAEKVAAEAERLQPLPRPLLLLWLKLKAQILILQHRYEALTQLLEIHVEELLDSPLTSPEQAELQAILLIYLMNAYTLLGCYEKVTEAAPLLEKILNHHSELRTRYGFFYYQTTVAAMCRTENYAEALAVIRRMEQETETHVNPRYLVFAAINKALCLYETGQWQEALKTLARLKTWEAFEHTDRRLQTQAEILEILLRLLLGDLDYAFQRAKVLLKEGTLPDSADEALLKHINALSRKSLSKIRAYLLQHMLKDEKLAFHEERQVIRYRKWAQVWADALTSLTV